MREAFQSISFGTNVVFEQRQIDRIVANQERIKNFNPNNRAACNIPKGQKICWMESVSHVTYDSDQIFFGQIISHRLDRPDGGCRNYYEVDMIWTIEQTSIGWKYKDLRTQKDPRIPTAHQVNSSQFDGISPEQFVLDVTGIKLATFIQLPNKYHGGVQPIRKKIGSALKTDGAAKQMSEAKRLSLRQLYNGMTGGKMSKVKAIAEEKDLDPYSVAVDLEQTGVSFSKREKEKLIGL